MQLRPYQFERAGEGSRESTGVETPVDSSTCANDRAPGRRWRSDVETILVAPCARLARLGLAGWFSGAHVYLARDSSDTEDGNRCRIGVTLTRRLGVAGAAATPSRA